MTYAKRILMEGGNHHEVKPRLRIEEHAQGAFEAEKHKQENSVVNDMNDQENVDVSKQPANSDENSSVEGISNGNTESNETYNHNQSSTIDNHHQISTDDFRRISHVPGRNP
ncbi:hypothetical protein AMTRI_Chr07g29440 [Amborella trichopoda]